MDKLPDCDVFEHVLEPESCVNPFIDDFPRNYFVESLVIGFVVFIKTKLLFCSEEFLSILWFLAKLFTGLPLDLFCDFLRQPHYIV